MPIPGFVYTALILGLLTFLQAISTGLDSLVDMWWQPLAVAAVAAAIKALEARKAQPPAAGQRSLEPGRGFWGRFLWG